jgi:hypothetical protein
MCPTSGTCVYGFPCAATRCGRMGSDGTKTGVPIAGPVAQWTEHRSSKPSMRVRFPPGPPGIHAAFQSSVQAPQGQCTRTSLGPAVQPASGRLFRLSKPIVVRLRRDEEHAASLVPRGMGNAGAQLHGDIT